MSIDYDRLRKLADEHTPGPWEQAIRGQIGNRALRMIVAFVGGDESGEEIGDSTLEADRELIALAPDMARELLRLRDGIEVIRDYCAGVTTVCRSSGNPDAPAIARELGAVDRTLADLLNGDTNEH